MSRFELWVVGVYSAITVVLIGYAWPFLVLTVLLVAVLPVGIAFIGQGSGPAVAAAIAVAAVSFIALFGGVANGLVHVEREGHLLLFYLWPIVWLRVGWKLYSWL